MGYNEKLFEIVLFSLFLITISSTVSASTADVAYINNFGDNGNISVIDTATNTQIATLPREIANPDAVAVTSDGTKVYVTGGFTNLGIIYEINTAINKVNKTVYTGNVMYRVAVNREGTKVYATDYFYARVYIWDTATNNVTEVPVGSGPLGVAVNQDETKVYVANKYSANVSVIDTATNNVTDVHVGNSPVGVAVSYDGTKVYVANSVNNVSVIDTATNNVTNIPLRYNSHDVAVSSDGTKVYVTGGVQNGFVAVIDTSTNNVTDVPVGSNPQGVAVTSDGTKVYVVNEGNGTDGFLSVIDTATNNVTDVYGFNWPRAYGHQFIGPAPQVTFPVANFSSNITSGFVPLSVQFTDLSTNATSWNWDFGDGTNSTEQNPMHTYSAIGNYTVNLTVSNAISSDSKNVTITVLTPMQAIKQTITFVERLIALGEINSGPGNALIGSLNASKGDLNSGNTLASTIELRTFIAKVKAYINIGILSPSNGQALIKDANDIINAIPKLSTRILETDHTQLQKTRTTRLISTEHTCYSK